MNNKLGTSWLRAAAWVAATLLLAGCNQEKPVQRYVPGLGEIMTATQMRHAKLWLAAQRGNWPLAQYEIDELEEGFDDAMEFHPTHKSSPLSIKDLIPQMTSGPVAALRSAVDEGNSEAFTKAFDVLTVACNSCHQATNFGFNVVTRPSANLFTNQDFAPPPNEPAER